GPERRRPRRAHRRGVRSADVGSVRMAKTKAPERDFETTIAEAYKAQGKTLELGKGILEGKVAPTAVVQVRVRMMTGTACWRARRTPARRRRRRRRPAARTRSATT